MEPGKRVMIGDILATSEELLPGPGTFDDGEHLRAARVGVFKIDGDEFAAVIEPSTKTPVVLKPGDVIIGDVYTVQESIVGITARFRIGDERREIASDVNGTLHVSKAADRFIAVLNEVFKKGDIVRAKVVQGAPSLQLTTKGEEFGVIFANCELCRNPLGRKDDVLECTDCQHREVRYIAGDYGTGDIEARRENLQGDQMQRGDRVQQPPNSGPPPVRPGLRVIPPLEQMSAFGHQQRGGPGGRGGGRGGPRRDGGGRGGPRREGGRGGRSGDRGGPRRDGGGRGGPRREGGRGGRGGERSGPRREGGRSGGRGGARRGGGDRGGRSE